MTLDIKKIGALIPKGLIMRYAPDVVMGALKSYFKGKKLDVMKATEWVEDNNNLWGSLGEEHQKQIKMAARKIGKIDFLTADWAIEGLRDDFPALASLFLGWNKARNWLERQLAEIKNKAIE